jgi:uncharacterized protein YbjT (DUF2867 family)
MTWKLKGEDYLRSSGIAYTIIRPGGLKDLDAGAMGIVLKQGDSIPYNSPESQTGRGDLASICIAALDEPATRFRTFETANDSKAVPGAWRKEFAALSPDPR